MRLARDIGTTHYTMCALQHLGSVAARRGAYHHAAVSPANPQYLVKSDKTGAQAAHKPKALKKKSP